MSAPVSGVYSILNTATGKRYVGSASKSIQDRWSSHRSDLLRGRHSNARLQHAWNKYGQASFTFSILEECAPDCCIEREQYWIDYYSAADRNKGYNIRTVADSNIGMKMPLKETPRRATENKRRKLQGGYTIKALLVLQRKRKPRKFVAIAPDGTQYQETNLQDFCKKHHLTRSGMAGVAAGEYRHHKGWRCYYV